MGSLRIDYAQLLRPDRRPSGRRRHGVALLVGVVGLLVAVSQVVDARSYTLDAVTVVARVEPDGSLWIAETRTYTYDGRYSWADFRLPLDRVGSLSEFSLSDGDVQFVPSGGEEPGTYTVESSAEEFYVRWHYVAEDERRSFQLSYRISDAVRRHADVAELYYQFVGAINPQAIGRVHVDLELPQPATFGEVRAWAHGPLHGRVDFEASGRLAFDVTSLVPNQMWEARVTFPRTWVPVGAPAVSGGPALDRILAEEDAWAREANDRRERDQLAEAKRAHNAGTARQLSGALAGLGLLTVVVGYLKAGRAHQVAAGVTRRISRTSGKAISSAQVLPTTWPPR